MIAEPPSTLDRAALAPLNGERKKELRKLAAAKQPRKETSHGMQYLFQAFCRDAGVFVPPFDVIGETAHEAAFHVQQMGLELKSLGVGRPLLPEREILMGRDEISAFLGIEPSTLAEWVRHGFIKQAKEGDVMATKSAIIAFITKRGLRDPED